MLTKISIILAGFVVMIGSCTSSFAQSCRTGDYCESYAQHASERWIDGNDAVENALAHAYLGGDFGAIPVHARQKSIGKSARAVAGGVLVGLRPDTHINQEVYDDAYRNCQKEIRSGVHQYRVRYQTNLH